TRGSPPPCPPSTWRRARHRPPARRRRTRRRPRNRSTKHNARARSRDAQTLDPAVAGCPGRDRPPSVYGVRRATIACAMVCNGAARLLVQIDATMPLLPNWLASWVMRTAGSAKLVSAAVHEWAITGHGHDAAPHELSEVLGAFHVTT